MISRQDYQEILLARMAGGDLYACETLQRVRYIDQMLDCCRTKPIYHLQTAPTPPPCMRKKERKTNP